MNARSVLEDWETAAFDGGFSGLRSLATRGFDGALEAAGTWLFLRDGEPIAVLEDLDSSPRPGDIDAFEDASGTRYEAPNSAAATLAAMLALDGEVRGRYFTDDTPLSAVHETLSGGGFTGYVELSENVLSGDYYYVYVDGEVEHVGFVGSSQRLYGEDALQRAENEVGIYAVVAVSFPDLEIPEPTPAAEPEPDLDSDPNTADDTVDPGSDSDAEPEHEPKASKPELESESEPEPTPTSEREPGRTIGSDSGPASDAGATPHEEDPTESTTAGEEPSEPADTTADTDAEHTAETPERSGDSDDGSADAEAGGSATATPDGEASAPSDSSVETDSDPEWIPTGPGSNASESATEDDTPEPYPPAGDSVTTATEPEGSERNASGIGSLTTRQVPSLDPERSSHRETDSEDTRRVGGKFDRDVDSTAAPSDSADAGTSGEQPSAAELDEHETRIEELNAELTDRNERIDTLESELADREERIGSLESELQTVRAERAELESELETLAPDSATGGSLTEREALAGTSLFVRERTRGEPTLEDAHEGTADREAVTENLRIEFHTTFDSDDRTVDGQPFETWLRSAAPYEFAEWLVGELLFEIRSTNTQDGLRPLYDALPTIDRVGFDETISVDADGEEASEEVNFDIVARDRKGNPIVVAHFDQKREPTRADTLEPLITAGSNVCQAHGTLAAAVAVSSSYFEADAMTVAEEATSSSLLSRSKHRSYVTLSRSSGYHLCLVEARDGSFNLAVPEL